MPRSRTTVRPVGVSHTRSEAKLRTLQGALRTISPSTGEVIELFYGHPLILADGVPWGSALGLLGFGGIGAGAWGRFGLVLVARADVMLRPIGDGGAHGVGTGAGGWWDGSEFLGSLAFGAHTIVGERIRLTSRRRSESCQVCS